MILDGARGLEPPGGRGQGAGPEEEGTLLKMWKDVRPNKNFRVVWMCHWW